MAGKKKDASDRKRTPKIFSLNSFDWFYFSEEHLKNVLGALSRNSLYSFH